VLGIADADSAEHRSASKNLFIVPVSCPVPVRAPGAPQLSGTATIRIRRDSRAFRIYKHEEIEEGYFCNYESNPARQAELEAAGLRFTGFGPQGEARIAELEKTPAGKPHPWFFVTLFQPMLASAPGHPHPVIVSFLKAARRH
jgi:CTP synthase